jgi:hypothetical protein
MPVITCRQTPSDQRLVARQFPPRRRSSNLIQWPKRRAEPNTRYCDAFHSHCKYTSKQHLRFLSDVIDLHIRLPFNPYQLVTNLHQQLSALHYKTIMFAKALLLGALAALATAQSAVLTFTRVPNPVTDGEPQAITYATNDTTSPVTIILRKGTSKNLQTIATLTTDANGGQFIWTPPPSLPNDNDYALEIRWVLNNSVAGSAFVNQLLGKLAR